MVRIGVFCADWWRIVTIARPRHPSILYALFEKEEAENNIISAIPDAQAKAFMPR